MHYYQYPSEITINILYLFMNGVSGVSLTYWHIRHWPLTCCILLTHSSQSRVDGLNCIRILVQACLWVINKWLNTRKHFLQSQFIACMIDTDFSFFFELTYVISLFPFRSLIVILYGFDNNLFTEDYFDLITCEVEL